MEAFLKGIGVAVLVAVALVGLAIVGAYPVKWAVNYLINPRILLNVFGVAKFTFWHAFALNWLSGSLIKSTPSVNTK